MNISTRQLFLSAGIAFFLTLTLATFAQDTKQPDPALAPPSTDTSTPAPTPPAPAPIPAEQTAVPATTPADGATVSTVSPTVAPSQEAEKSVPPKMRRLDEDDKSSKPIQSKRRHKLLSDLGVSVDGKQTRGGNDRVRVMNDNRVPTGTVVKGNAVAVFGDLKVDGEVMHDAVAVLGDVTINGTVHHSAVAVMGDLTLGPQARVEGDIVCVGGEVHRDPGAYVGGEVRVKAADGDLDAFNTWWGRTMKLGRPLAIGAHLGWLWIVTGFSVAFYALLALIFPKGVRNCGDKLVLQPGLTILASVLGMLALPVLFILLCITIIGIPVAFLLLPLAVVLAVFFGKAAIYTLVGRKISGDRLHPAVAAIAGALIFIVLYLVPVFGLLLSLLVALIGFGCVILTLFAPTQKPAVATAATSSATIPLAALAVSPGDTTDSGIIAPPVIGGAPLTVPPPVPPLPAISALTLPRAGFWIRVAAALLDTILIGIMVGMFEAFFHAFRFHPGEAFPFWVILYSVIMWATKATTIGGVICGLRVVRLDDRPMDWGIAIVRALGALLSLAVFGLGFIWVAFDSERQSWHDKIAGTTIVRVPRGTPLL